MHYIVLDLEWNQAMSSKSSIFYRLPIHLRGEIIQIGAVKLDESLRPAEEFQADVRPVYFRKIHHKVGKLTGFDKDRLNKGEPFKQAIERFLSWCGDDCTFLTWGFDDKGIMEQNLIIHDLDIDWVGNWVNLQIIFNLQIEGDKNQKSLSTAMEHFGIEQTRTAHDALADAYNTALVCSHLNLTSGLQEYADGLRMLSCRSSRPAGDGAEYAPIEHLMDGGHASRDEVWANAELTGLNCPDCGEPLPCSRWVHQGDRRYMSLAKCEEHGSFLLRLRLRKAEDGTWTVNRLVYRATEEMLNFYNKKAGQPASRGRRRRRKASA